MRQAYRPWELAGSNQLRHDTFVNEQGIFEGNDRDEIDRDMITIVAVSTLASEEDEVVGTVRIHQPEQGFGGARDSPLHPNTEELAKSDRNS